MEQSYASFRASFRIARPEKCWPVYTAMEQEGLLPVVFYDSTMTRQSFAQCMDSSVMLLMERGQQLLGCAWLRDVHVRTASIHFCFFQAGRPESVALGRACLEHIFSMGNLEALYGVTPRPYRSAVRYISAVGGQVLGEVPGACMLHHRGGRVVPAVISVLNRKEYV